MFNLHVRGSNNTIVFDSGDFPPPMPENAVLVAMTEEERDQVLAALRFWQHVDAAAIPLEIQEIACNGRECSLNNAEIDELCESFNG